MREINNGTLKGLLKKTNRPSQTRKNRVVFDETRNEFFEADYIILIREECTFSEDDEEPCSCTEQDFVKKCYDETCQCNYETESKQHSQSPKTKDLQNPKNLSEITEETLSPPDGYKDNRPINPISEALSGHIFGTHHIQQLQVIQKLQQQRAAILAARINIQNKINEQNENNICNECVECVECSQNSIENLGAVSAAVSLFPIDDKASIEKITQKEIIAGEEHPKYKAENDSKDSLPENQNPNNQAKQKKNDSRKNDSGEPNINGILKNGKLKYTNEPKLDVDKLGSEKMDENYKRSVRFQTQNKTGTTDAKELCPQEENDLINELIPIRKHSTLFNNINKPNSAVRQLFPEKVKPENPNQYYDKNSILSEAQIGKSNQDLIRMNIERGTLRRSLLRKKNGKSDTSLEEQLKLLTCDIEDSNDEIQQIRNNYGCEFVELENSCNENLCSASFSAVYSKVNSSDTYIPCSSVENQAYEKDREEILEQPNLVNPDDSHLSSAPDIALEMHIPVNEIQYQQATYRNNDHKRQFLSTFVPLTSCMAGQKDDLPYCSIEQYKEIKSNEQQLCKPNFSIAADFNNESNCKVAPDVIVGTPGLEQQLLSQISKFDVIQRKKTQNKVQKLSSSNNSDDDEQSDYGFNKRPSVKGIKTKYKLEIDDNNDSKDSEQEKNSNQQNVTINDKNNIQTSNTSSQASQQRNDRTFWNYNDVDKISVENLPASSYPVELLQTLSGQSPYINHSCTLTNLAKKTSKFQKSPTSKRPESPPPYKNYYQTMVLIPCNTGSYTTQYITNGEHHHIQSKNILEYQKVTQQTIRVPISYSFPSMKMHLARDREDLNMCYGYTNPKGNVNIAQVIQLPNVEEKTLTEGAAAISFSECKQIISTAKLSSFGLSENSENFRQDSDITFYANSMEKI